MFSIFGINETCMQHACQTCRHTKNAVAEPRGTRITQIHG